ncbi:MAG: GNAT family acetyltransferase [Dorea sp.]
MISAIGLCIKSLKKEPYSGSCHGMRFFLSADKETMHVWIYPEPWCFEQTPDEVKTQKDFPFTQEGLDEALLWLEEMFDSRRSFWEQKEKDKMKIFLGS